MHKLIQKEVHVLDRIMYTLGEGSVSRLTREDAAFARYIDELHETLRSKSDELLRSRIPA